MALVAVKTMGQLGSSSMTYHREHAHEPRSSIFCGSGNGWRGGLGCRSGGKEALKSAATGGGRLGHCLFHLFTWQQVICRVEGFWFGRIHLFHGLFVTSNHVDARGVLSNVHGRNGWVDIVHPSGLGIALVVFFVLILAGRLLALGLLSKAVVSPSRAPISPNVARATLGKAAPVTNAPSKAKALAIASSPTGRRSDRCDGWIFVADAAISYVMFCTHANQCSKGVMLSGGAAS